jgi:hypothetical protein
MTGGGPGAREGLEATDMSENGRDRIKIDQHSFGGMIWLGGWLFTLGFLGPSFWKGVLALFIWPYYLGVTFAPMLGG